MVVCVELAHSSLGYREDIFITCLIMIIKLEAQPLIVIFFRGHVPEVVPYISWESWVLCLVLPCIRMLCANNRVHYYCPMVLFVCLHITRPHYHNHIPFWGYWTFKMLSDTLCLQCVSRIKKIISIIFHAIYETVCIQFTHYYCHDCENMCTLHYYHHQIGSMAHFPLFRVRSWSNVLHLYVFLYFFDIHVNHYFEGSFVRQKWLAIGSDICHEDHWKWWLWRWSHPQRSRYNCSASSPS